MEKLDCFAHQVMDFMVKLRTENIFDDELYDHLYRQLELFVEEWRNQENIPKSAFISCIYLTDFLAGGSRFLSEEDGEKVEDACNAVNELLTSLERGEK